MFRSSGTSVLAFVLAAFVGCGSKAVTLETPAAPVAEAPAPAPEPEAEPEVEPVVATPPKSLDIQKDVIRLKRGIKILFATNADGLLPASFEILDEVASVMEQNARLRIRVEGHTDDAGEAAHNQDLSTRRAASVRTYLVQKGIAEDRLESTGCGEAVAVADNATDDGKQQNRRVEFAILRRKRARPPCQLYKPREAREQAPAPADAPAGTP